MKACGECHENHEENNTWRHDIKHVVENDIQTMRRIGYGEYHMENVTTHMDGIIRGDRGFRRVLTNN